MFPEAISFWFAVTLVGLAAVFSFRSGRKNARIKEGIQTANDAYQRGINDTLRLLQDAERLPADYNVQSLYKDAVKGLPELLKRVKERNKKDDSR